MIETLADVMLFGKMEEQIVSDNGPKVAKELRQWLRKWGGTLYIEPVSPEKTVPRKFQQEVA